MKFFLYLSGPKTSVLIEEKKLKNSNGIGIKPEIHALVTMGIKRLNTAKKKDSVSWKSILREQKEEHLSSPFQNLV